MRRSRFFKWLPTSESIRENRFLKPFGHYLHHHFLWQFNRRSVAGGLAVGLFFGILIPFAQILLAAVAAVFLRVNLPVAAFSTLITNPFTFPAVYYVAYRLGELLTGSEASVPEAAIENEVNRKIVDQQADVGGWFENSVEWMQSVGPSLGIGLSVLAIVSAVAGYIIVSLLWSLHARRRWRKRRLRQP
jgi:uncharacterized protein (DUF2062 family)